MCRNLMSCLEDCLLMAMFARVLIRKSILWLLATLQQIYYYLQISRCHYFPFVGVSLTSLYSIHGHVESKFIWIWKKPFFFFLTQLFRRFGQRMSCLSRIISIFVIIYIFYNIHIFALAGLCLSLECLLTGGVLSCCFTFSCSIVKIADAVPFVLPWQEESFC